MFLDWYVRFRGIDEWPETTGLVQDFDTFKLRYNPKKTDKTFVIAAHEDSPFKELFVTIFVAVAIMLLIDRFARH